MKLAVRNLKAEIQSSQILRGIGIEVGDNELVCLVGRNGAGKTTTLRTIMGFQRAAAGTIEVDGRSIVGMPTERIAQLGIGFSPEESEVFGDLTVAQNIELPTWTRSTARSAEERIAFAYEVFPKLRGYAARGGAQLSGGERKMLSIARALALDAALLLLDEPFEGLSPAIIPDIGDSIHRIVQTGRSVLQAESNLHHVPSFAARLYVIERGEIIFVGTPTAAHKDPSVMRVLGGAV